MTVRKLIEVSLPLEVINRGLKAEKDRKVGKPQHIHHWWARRPITAARTVLFAQLVDDPSSHPEIFPTLEQQHRERARLHGIAGRLAQWDAINDDRLLDDARKEIARWSGGRSPVVIDPFAGGGAIPIEAQRLGLEVHASDINPVAVLINRALVEIPPRFAGCPPVFPDAASTRIGEWPRATGLAEDVRRYGAWMLNRARERIDHLYPTAKLHGDSEATVISWIWARTVVCPNPACAIALPLVQSWWLSKKRGRQAYVVPDVAWERTGPPRKRIDFRVGRDLALAPTKATDGTVGRSGAKCVACGNAVELSYIRTEAQAGRLGTRLMALVCESPRGRLYLPPTDEHEARALRVTSALRLGRLSTHPQYMGAPRYGMTDVADLFTPRQLAALETFSDLVDEVRERARSDAERIGLHGGPRLAAGGDGASAYADALATYLALACSRLADWSNSICRWESTGEVSQQLFGQQTIPIAWDFSESNTLASSSGSFAAAVKYVAAALEKADAGIQAYATQVDAAVREFPAGSVISTDPPYYDNVPYADLSDFFYVWLRRSLRTIHPDLFATLLTPKSEELVADYVRQGGKEQAAEFFTRGFVEVFSRARALAGPDDVMTVYYAFKQQELDAEGLVSGGWASILEGILQAGWRITATWPLRTETAARLRAQSRNALASSIVLALRPRHETALASNRRGFVAALKEELPRALSEMQQGAIAPVDLAQATIGPGMAIFSRYSQVIESDGSPMTVKTALALINQALDEVLAEQDGDLDADSRFCLRWYKQFGWKPGDFGVAESMANALNTPVKALERGGVLVAREGRVSLLRPRDLPATWDPTTDDRVSVWEVACHLAQRLSTDGVDATAPLMAAAGTRVDLESVQLLAYRIYELAQHKDPEDAGLFNVLASEWAPLSAAAQRVDARGSQGGLDLGEL